MKFKLPSLCWFVLALGIVGSKVTGQAPQPKPVPNGSGSSAVGNQATECLAAAIAQVEACETISAKLRQMVNLYGRQLVGSGTYLQGPASYDLLRLDLQLQEGNETHRLLQVSDGRHFWTHRRILGQESLTRVDLDRVAEALAQASTAPAPAATTLGVGGLIELLRGLQQSFQFGVVYEARLGTLPVRAIEGQWKPDQLVQVLSRFKTTLEQGQLPDPQEMPEHLPDRVVLFLGQDDYFPYRVEYRRSIAADNEAASSPGSRMLAAMEWLEVRLNGPIDRLQFAYQPGDLKATDVTDEYLASRGLVAPDSK